MRHFEVPDDVTPDEAAAAILAIEALLHVEGRAEMPPVIDQWVRAARLEAQGLPVRGNQSSGWRARRHV